jgi:hypothetical protein
MDDWMDSAVLEVAQKHLELETLETRNSDSLDFHTLSVWQIKEALEEAYSAGARNARRETY